MHGVGATRRYQKLIFPKVRTLLGNVDLAVLRPENQNPTHVTPLIATLTAGFFREMLVVVGPPPTPPNKDLVKQQERQAFLRLCDLIMKAARPKRTIRVRDDQRLKPRSYWVKAVEVDGETYAVCSFTQFICLCSFPHELRSLVM